MEWFNVSGLVFMVIILIPNLIFAIKNKDGFENKPISKAIIITEQVGRYGCFGFMVFNIPCLTLGWASHDAHLAYLITNALLVILYCVLWGILWKKNSIFKAWVLSVIPSALFLFSGIISRSITLTVSALIFAPSHIIISVNNAKK